MVKTFLSTGWENRIAPGMELRDYRLGVRALSKGASLKHITINIHYKYRSLKSDIKKDRQLDS